MCRVRTILLIWAMAMVLLAVETNSQDGPLPGIVSSRSAPPRISSAKELWDKARAMRLLDPPPAPITAPPPSNAAYWWIVTYLGSKDPEIRDAAAEIVAKSKRGFAVDAVLRYLSPENPKFPRNSAIAN